MASDCACVEIDLDVPVVTLAPAVVTCALAANEEGVTDVLDFAWNAGLVRALKAPKKLAKNGLCVDILYLRPQPQQSFL